MKTLLCFAMVLAATFGIGRQASAQNTVLESNVVLTSTILTQGTDTVKRTVFGVTITTRNIKSTPFNNRSILTEMLTRGLLSTTSVSGWSLVVLKDDQGASGLYAKKSSAAYVAVPADLLTLPTFGPAINGGTTIETSFGVSATGTSAIAFANAVVNGIPVSGLATNGIHTVKVKNTDTSIEAVTTAMTFDGGVDGNATPNPRLAKGVLAIGSAKISTLVGLPPAN